MTLHPRIQLYRAQIDWWTSRVGLRHELERWWHRRGVWWFVLLVPRWLRYWIIIKATNAYSWAHPTQVVPTITWDQVLQGVYPKDADQ